MEKQLQEQHIPITYQNYSKTYEARMRLRAVNFERRGQSDPKPRSAQIKAIQKFIGRFRIDNKNHEVILAEMETLNLSKYLQEISSIVVSCVSEKQIRFYAEVATRLNQEYDDFPGMIVKDLSKQFNNCYESSQDNKSKLKAILLFTTELFVCGFAFPYKEISEMLKKLVKAGTKKRSTFTTEKQLRLFAYFYNCDCYSAFLVQFCTIFTQATPKWISKWRGEGLLIQKYPEMIPAKVKEDITNILFANYISSCLTVLEAAFERLKELQNELRENLRMSGEFNKVTELNYNQLKQKFIFTQNYLSILVNALNYNINLREYNLELVDVEDIMKKYVNKVENVQIFENQFERELYLELPELCKTENKNATNDEYREFKERLDKCKNKNQSEEIAKLFETVNNKRTRKLLAQDVLQYRKEYQLVTPFLCRTVAIVALSYRDIVETVTDTLFSDYERLHENANSNFVINDKKSRNLKYICQFTKFRTIDSDKTISCIQGLIDDLKGFNIELLISALESVGRFLYLSPNNANKFTFMLSKLENVMKQKSFPLFTTSQLFNSINLLKPHVQPERTPSPELTPIQKEAKQILEKDVINELEDMVQVIRKLVLTGEGLKAVQDNLIKQIEKYDFLGSYNYVYMINELNIDEITEFVIKMSLEKLEQATKIGNYQSCLLWSRFFGELFKYGLIRRGFLFEHLAKFIALEGANEISIINLVCTVLQSCQNFLDSKKSSVRNQKFLFLVDFKTYIQKCLYVPMLEQFKICDVFDDLEPNLTSIKHEILVAFMKENEENKQKKDFDYSKAFDIYLQKRNLKEVKVENMKEKEDPRSQIPVPEPNEPVQKNNEAIAAESKLFETQFLSVLSGHMKDLSSRIAKPAIVEKNIQRKKDKRKVGEGEKKIVVIARNGSKFTKKDVVYNLTPNEIEANGKLE